MGRRSFFANLRSIFVALPKFSRSIPCGLQASGYRWHDEDRHQSRCRRHWVKWAPPRLLRVRSQVGTRTFSASAQLTLPALESGACLGLQSRHIDGTANGSLGGPFVSRYRGAVVVQVQITWCVGHAYLPRYSTRAMVIIAVPNAVRGGSEDAVAVMAMQRPAGKGGITTLPIPSAHSIGDAQS